MIRRAFVRALSAVAAAPLLKVRAATEPTERTIYVYVDGIDPKNGRHQQLVSDALVAYNERRPRNRLLPPPASESGP